MPLAIPLAPVEIILVGAILLLIYYGGVSFAHLLAALVRGAPLVGDTIAGWIESAVADWLTGVREMVRAATQPVINLFSAPARVINFFVSAAVAAADHVMSSVVWVSTVLIPAWGAAVLRTAAVAIAQVHGFAAAVLTELRSFEQTATGLVARLQDWVAGTVVPALQHDIGAVQSFITGQLLPWVSGLIRDLQTSVIDLTHRADAQAAQMAALGAAVGAIPGYVAGQVTAGVREAEGAAQGLVGSLYATLAPTVAATAAEATTAAQFVKECGEPMCDWWNANTPGLSSILSLVEIAGLAVLVEQAVTHPEEVGRAVATAFDDVRAVASPVLDLLGVSAQAA